MALRGGTTPGTHVRRSPGIYRNCRWSGDRGLVDRDVPSGNGRRAPPAIRQGSLRERHRQTQPGFHAQTGCCDSGPESLGNSVGECVANGTARTGVEPDPRLSDVQRHLCPMDARPRSSLAIPQPFPRLSPDHPRSTRIGSPGAPVADPGLLGTRPQRAAEQPASPKRGEVVVKRGDSLWSIAARQLGPMASDVDIALHWPKWYATNRTCHRRRPWSPYPGSDPATTTWVATSRSTAIRRRPAIRNRGSP